MNILRHKITKEIVTRSNWDDGYIPEAAGRDDCEIVRIVQGDKPAFDHATQKLVGQDTETPGDPIILTQGWTVVNLTAEELAAIAAEAAAKTERQQIKALMADIKAGTGTNGERIARIEKALHRLLKDTLR